MNSILKHGKNTWKFTESLCNVDLKVSRKRIEEACPKPTPALLRMRDHFQSPRDFRRRAFDINGLPFETTDLKQVSS